MLTYSDNILFISCLECLSIVTIMASSGYFRQHRKTYSSTICYTANLQFSVEKTHTHISTMRDTLLLATQILPAICTPLCLPAPSFQGCNRSGISTQQTSRVVPQFGIAKLVQISPITILFLLVIYL